MRNQPASHNQLSLIPAFGAMNHPEAARYNAGKDRWQQLFGGYATLERYTPEITRISQSAEQQQALIQGLMDPMVAPTLCGMDVGDDVLNGKIRRIVAGASMIVQERAWRSEHQRSADSTLEAQEQQRRQENEQKGKALLDLLERREKLLAYEGVFDRYEKAQQSIWVKKAAEFPDLQVVITPQQRWFGGDPVGPDGRVLCDPMAIPGQSLRQGHFETTYILTFSELSSASTQDHNAMGNA